MYKEQRQKEMRETLKQTDKVSWSEVWLMFNHYATNCLFITCKMVDIQSAERRQFKLEWNSFCPECAYIALFIYFFVTDFTSKSRFWEDKTNCDLKDNEKAWEYNNI